MDWKKTGSIIPKATSTIIGGVKVGDNITVTDDGTISTHAPYTLPVATASALGGIKQGNGLVIEKDGTARVRGDSGVNVTANGVGLDWDMISSMIGGGGVEELDVSLIATDSSATLTTDSALALTATANGVYTLTGDATHTAYARMASGYSQSTESANQVRFTIGSCVSVGSLLSAGVIYKVVKIADCQVYGSTSISDSPLLDLFVVIDTSVSAPVGTLTYVPQIGLDYSRTNLLETIVNGCVYLNMPAAGSSTLGGVKEGMGVSIDRDGTLSISVASSYARGGVKPSKSITAASDGTIKVNPAIFSDGLTATDAQVSADMGFIGEHLAGDALYYDATHGLMLKTGTGLHIDNDTVSVDTDTLPLATASTRGTVKVGSGLSIAEDGTLSATGAAASADGVRYVGMVGGTGSTGLISTLANVLANYDDTRVWYDVITATFAFNTTVAFTAGTTATFTMGSGYSFDVTGDDTFWECVTDNASVKATITNATTLTLSFTSDVAAATTFHVKVR